MDNFTIDFFELGFLAEACIPPQPIARTAFFQKLIDVHYHNMTNDQRGELWAWISSNPRFSKWDKLCDHFHHRYGECYQFLVKTKNGQQIECYLFDDHYHTKVDTWIDADHIIEVKPIFPQKK